MIGSFATSKAGHDKGACYVILKEDGAFVYLCDGRCKPVRAPKKKSRKHIQLINRTVSLQIAEKLAEGLPVTDEEVKYEIKQYKKQV
ncbi:MAG: KOW domain-containing RNA-binding protein [Lachnospiraceae bacterium]|nr:KOW domain-containing RNA-binding protein [Lachnospiraceae bacterium]